ILAFTELLILRAAGEVLPKPPGDYNESALQISERIRLKSLERFYTINPKAVSSFPLIITEIFADPSPVVGLPEYEFVEIYNRSNQPVNLKGWSLSDATSTGLINTDRILEPYEYIILCNQSAASALSAISPVIALSRWPSLDNAGDLLVLADPYGSTVHAVQYNTSWYNNSLKANGGWTLELTDPNNPCGGSNNWSASIDPSGGTPGRKNSIYAENPDDAPAELLRSFVSGDDKFVLVFNESLDSMHATSHSHFFIHQHTAAIKRIAAIPPLFSQVEIQLNDNVPNDTVLLIEVNNIKDCAGNEWLQPVKVRVGMPSSPLPGELVINEILFDPFPLGEDFIELYNNSKKIIDLSRLSIANVNSSGDLANITKISSSPYYLFPGEYLALTPDSTALQKQYLVKFPSALLELNLPSFPNSSGSVILLNEQGEVLDRLDYHESWHAPLISNKEGISLERINPDLPTQNPQNWHSAAASAGYATPGYENSQYATSFENGNVFSVASGSFSPNGDGQNDLALIHYEFNQPGYITQIVAYNVNGHPVKTISSGSLAGLKGHFKWDGTDDKLRKLPNGIYILVCAAFHPEGKTIKQKLTVVISK
ncbi:MAG TPA: lamin tail domain-containing protein, partial [Parasegetibacter sp.]